MKKVSIIIPTKNEEKTLEELLLKLNKVRYEILVVDGHSTDRTSIIAKKHAHKLIFDNKKGKGDALRTALKYAKGEIIVFIDSDGSHNPEHIEDLVGPIQRGQADMVIASRMLGGSEEFFGNPADYFRFLTNKVANFLINKRFKSKVTDAVNGFRAVKKNALQELDLVGNGFSIEQEMTIKMLHKGYQIIEIPSFEKKRQHGKSHLTVKKWPELIINYFRWFV